MKNNFARKLEKFSAAVAKINVEKLYMQAIKETSELALDLNRAQMTELGVDSENKPLGQYTENTKRIKRSKGQFTGFINLLDTGSFQDRMFIDLSQQPVMIDSRDQKTSEIEKRWPEALGLIPQFKEQYKDIVMKAFRTKYIKAIEEKKKILQ